VPIPYALTNRAPAPGATDLARWRLTFEEPDTDRFPCLALARAALVAEGRAPVVLNAANEIAVAAFLDRRLGFTDIPAVIERALAADRGPVPTSIEECVEVDAQTRREVNGFLARRRGRTV
jgi:1-deoxy-D-xylulose-5-phosphate reductoisomerase